MFTDVPLLDRRTRNFYDGDGNLLGVIDPEGFLTTFSYDGAGRLTKKIAYANGTNPATRYTETLANLIPAVDNEIVIDPEQDIICRYYYDGQGRLIGELDGENYLTETAYFEDGKIRQSIRYHRVLNFTEGTSTFATLKAEAAAAGAITHVTSFEYDGAGRLTQTTNFENTITKVDYDLADNVVATTQALGSVRDERTTAARYDLAGRVTQELSAEGRALITAGMAQGDIENIWTRYGVSYTYDEAGRRKSATVRPNDQQTNTSYFFYDNASRLRFTVDARGQVYERRYDALGNLESEIEYYRTISTAGLGGGLLTAALTTTLTASANASVDKVVTNLYGFRGKVTSSFTSTGNASYFYYSPFGQQTYLQDSVDARFLSYKSEYDKRGMLTSTSLWDDSQENSLPGSTRTYDPFGRLRTVTDANGHVTSYEYNRLGRQIASVDEAGGRRVTVYDAFSRVVSTRDALGNTTSYVYEDALLTLRVTTPENVVVTTEHNREGQTVRVTAAGNDTIYTYDRNGKLTGISDNLGALEGRTYDRSGRQVTQTDAHNLQTTFAYDASSRLLTRTVDTGAGGTPLITTYGYDPLLRLLDVTEPGNRVTRTEYDQDGRVKALTVDPNGAARSRTEFSYDLDDKVVLMIEGVGSNQPRKTLYVYDLFGRRTDEYVDPTEFGGTLNLHTEFKYDNKGNVTRKIDASGNSTWYVYDVQDRLVQTIDALGEVTQLTYDAEDRITVSRSYATAVSTAGLYDVASLQSVTTSASDRVTRSIYDRDGREIYSVTTLSATGSPGSLTETGVVTARTFDANGNVTLSRVHGTPITIPSSVTAVTIAAQLSVNAAQDQVQTTVYDLRGRALFKIDSNRDLTRLWYDNAGHVVRRTDYAIAVPGAVALTVTELTTWSDGRQTDVSNRNSRFVFDRIGRQQYSIATASITVNGSVVDERAVVTENTFNEAGDLAQARVYRNSIKVPDTVTTATINTALGDYGNDVTSLHPDDHVERMFYDAAGRLEIRIDGSGAVTRYQYDANGNITQRTEYASTVPLDGAMRVRYVPSTNSSASLYLGSFNTGDVVTATVRFKSSSDTSGAMFLGDAGGPNPYDNAVYTGVVYGNDGWQTLTLSVTMSHADDMWVYLYGDRDGAYANSTHSVLYDDVKVVSVQRGKVLEDKFDGTTGAWSISGAAQSETVTLSNLGSEPAIRGLVNSLGSSADDRVTRFWYDAAGRVRFSLDGEGYLKETRYSDATRESVDISYAGKPTGITSTSDLSAVVTRAAAAANRLQDRMTTTLRDVAGRTLKVTQVYDYRSDDAVPEATVFEQYTYDGVGNKLTYRNANGDVWTYKYDANGRLTDEISPLVTLTSIADLSGTLTPTPESASVLTRITYDAFGNVKTRTEGIRRYANNSENTAGSRTTTYGYDALGRQTSVTHPQAAVYSYPANDHLNVATGAQLQETTVTPTSTTTYNALGDAIINVDVSGAVSRKAYDTLGRVKFEIDALGFVTEYTYNPFGNTTELTRYGNSAYSQPAGTALATTGELSVAQFETFAGSQSNNASLYRTIITEYDRLNRRVKVKEPDSLSYTPGEGGALSSSVMGWGETRFEYNAFGQLSRERKLLDFETQKFADTFYFHYKDGQRRFTVDALGYVTEENFDGAGNLKLHIEYAKKLSGSPPWNPQFVTATLHNASDPQPEGGIDRKTTYDYDSLGRLRRQSLYEVQYATGSGAATSTLWGTQQSDFEYDAVGNRTSVKDHYGAMTYTYYDVLGRVRAIAQPARSADTNGDYVAETGVIPLTEMKRNVYGDLVEQIRYGSSATGVSATGYTAPAGGTRLWNRMLLDNYGRVKRSQDSTLASRYMSYTVRGDVAKEWMLVANADNVTDVVATIHEYDALGREVATVQPQRRADVATMSGGVFQSARWYQVAGGAPEAWVDENILVFTWPEIPAGRIRVEVDYVKKYRDNASPALGGFKSQDFDNAFTGATVRWFDAGTQDTDNGVHHITSWKVWSLDANGVKVAVLRDSANPATGPTVTIRQTVYTQYTYNGYGEKTSKGVNASRQAAGGNFQEYWSYDNAGRVWRTNAEDGVDKVYLYDTGGRATAQIRSQLDNYIRNLTDPFSAIGAPERMLTETLYDALDRVVQQRQPKFAIDERLDAAATSISISLVNGNPTLQWAGTQEAGIKTEFRYRLSTTDWQTLPVVQLSAGVLGVDVSSLGRPTDPVWSFQIVKSLSLQYAPFALSSGTLRVPLGESVTVNLQGTNTNPSVATPVIGPGPALGPTTFEMERASAWYQSGPTGQWIYDNKVNARWDPTGLGGPVRVYLYYTRVLAGGAQIGDTETRSMDVDGSSGYAEFVWTDPNAEYPNPPGNGSIWSIQRIEVMGRNAQQQYTVLLRSSNGNPPPGPVRLRWSAPAEQFRDAVFHYKRADSSVWSTDITPTLNGGQYEIDVMSLLVDDTLYDYNIDY